jgi:hypothetical protein
MKDVTRRWSTWSLGLLATVALTGWCNSAELLMMSESAPRRAPATELEFRKVNPPLEQGPLVSHTSAIGGGLILLLSIGMVRSAQTKKHCRRSQSPQDRSLVPRPSDDLPNGAGPLPDEFEQLIAELDEMVASFQDAA